MGFLPGRGGVPWALAMAIALAPSCHEIDTERQAGRKGTLGDDMYGLMCDRLGASVLSEDLTGESYHSICHYDDEGRYQNDVDQSVLPPVKGEKAERARTLSLAKMHRMAIVRSPLVRAFNAAFPDIKVADPTTEDPDDSVRLHDALLQFSQDITLLYDDNPFVEGGEPVMPMMTDAFGRLFGALEESDEARAALERIAGRQGYRPFPVGLGAIRTLLAYPEMRSFIRAKMEVLGPNGTAVPELQQLLVTVKRELESSVPTLTDLPPYQVGPGAQPNRPRSALEVGRALLLATHDRFAVNIGEPPRFIAQRDERGLAVPAGNLPGVPGTVPAPFADADGDGYADVDAQGRFIDGGGALLPLDTPFLIPGKPFGDADEYMRPLSAPYQYVDTARTLLGAIARDLVPLVDPNRYASDGDPEPWKSENETLMYALAGMQLLAGPREPARFDHASETILPAGAPCPSSLCTDYQRFAGEASPIPDLVHAAGQILAHPDSDIVLLGLLELLENHEQVLARVLGAALRVKEIADQYETVELAYEVPVYDEIAQVVSDMAQHPGLIRKMLVALADPTIVQSHSQDPKITGAPAQHLGETLSAFVTFRDRYQYDPQNINSVAYNETDGWPSYANPHNPVDRSQPLTDENRSMFERALQAIYDASGIRACNKQGAKVYTGIGDIYWPLTGTYDECELFSFADVGAFYLDAQLPSNHPKRAELIIQATDMQALLGFVGTFTSIDSFLQSTSGITGLTLHPEPNALHRLLFYGSNSTQFGQLPDYDSVNAGSKTDKFVSSSLEPLGAVVCPKNSLGVPHCASSSDVLRMRDFGSIFAWERLGFTQYLKPQLKVFAEVGCNASVSSCDTEDFTGESYFLRLIGALWQNWPGADHGSYCDSNASSARYCSGAGINRYEPILAEAFLTDLIPALHEFARVATSVNITIERGPRAGQTVNGGEIIELLVKLLFDQQYAASVGMTDR
ncbi:MAG TPA: hypothetical protein VFB62_00350, partial [Polyangiaceae bacterium]|nr:hypothetical protein [Polyangiaceae bacterium]